MFSYYVKLGHDPVLVMIILSIFKKIHFDFSLIFFGKLNNFIIFRNWRRFNCFIFILFFYLRCGFFMIPNFEKK